MALYRVLAGKHIEPGEKIMDKFTDKDGNVKEIWRGRTKDKVYQAYRGEKLDGPRKAFTKDLVETDKDLMTIFQNKFEKLSEAPGEVDRLRKENELLRNQLAGTATKAPPAAAQLEKLSEAELNKLAADEEIDLKGAKSKDEKVRIIRAALG